MTHPHLIAATMSIENFEKIQKIWWDFEMNDEQKKYFGPEVGEYMLGRTKETAFVPNLMYGMDINRTTAEKIRERVEREIIDPIRELFERAQKGEFDDDGVQAIDEKYETILSKEETTQAESTPTTELVTRASVLNDIEDPLHSNPTAVEDRYSNHSPLNVLQDDVLEGIENPLPAQTETDEETVRGTQLDSELDAILKKPRVINTPVKNEIDFDLPTSDSTSQPVFQSSHNPKEPLIRKEVPAKIPQVAPRPIAPPGVDPYREPIE